LIADGKKCDAARMTSTIPAHVYRASPVKGLKAFCPKWLKKLGERMKWWIKADSDHDADGFGSWRGSKLSVWISYR